jgi:signal peptidase II
MMWGPLSRIGAMTAAVICAADQAIKLWMVYVYDLPGKGSVRVLPFLDFVLTWNKGISYGLFQQEGPYGRWVLLALTAIAIVLLWIWLARAHWRLTAFALGLIIGGALGNAIDRLHWPGVMDFVLFFIRTENINFSWYVFNLADAAIVAGVIGLLYESVMGGDAAKAP